MLYRIRMYLRNNSTPIVVEYVTEFTVKTKDNKISGYEMTFSKDPRHTEKRIYPLYVEVNDVVAITTEVMT